MIDCGIGALHKGVWPRELVGLKSDFICLTKCPFVFSYFSNSLSNALSDAQRRPLFSYFLKRICVC